MLVVGLYMSSSAVCKGLRKDCRGLVNKIVFDEEAILHS
jgi:hypothetical protein